MPVSIVILLYGGILLLPFSLGIECICTCTRSDGHVVVTANVTMGPPDSECITDSECDQPCRNSIRFPICTTKGACNRDVMSTRPTASLLTTSRPASTSTIDVKTCDPEQCCCPTDKIVIKRMNNNYPYYVSISMKLTGAKQMCGPVANLNVDNIRPSSSLLVQLQSAIILINMNNDTNAINTTFWDGVRTCHAKAARSLTSTGTIAGKQLLQRFAVLSIILVNILSNLC